MVEKKKEFLFLIGILTVALFLSTYGIQMGVPYRWFVDEVYAISIRILATRSLDVSQIYYFYHPPAYPMALALFLVPYLGLLKLIGFPLDLAGKSAAVSWTKMAFDFPGLASGIILWSRFFSVMCNVMSCYLVYRMGKKLAGTRTGLFSALVLATTMDFSGAHHFATNTPFVSLLVLLSVYSIIRFTTSGFNKQFIRTGAFAAGLPFRQKLMD